MAEFAVNNNNFACIKLSPFFDLKDLNLHMSLNIVDFWNIITCKQINKKKAINISEAMQLT